MNLSQSFVYDFLNRLTSVTETGGPQNEWSQSYNYDQWGNRAVTSSFIPNAYATPTALTQYSNNRWMGTGASYDAEGNQTTLPVRTFTYDAENRLTASSQPNTGAIQYAYDGEGRRIQKTVGAATTVFVYDAMGQLAAEYGASTAGGTQYVISDTLGSTRLLLNSAGAVAERLDYLPFGEELEVGIGGRTSDYSSIVYPSNPDQQDVKFTGKEREGSEDDFSDYFGARYFSAFQGRFQSIDPSFESAILEHPETWNRYSYVYNHPLSLTDPDGECPACIGALVGGIVEGGIDLVSQLRQNGGQWSQIDKGELTGTVLGGAVAGGLAGLTLGASLVADVAVGAAANVAGGITDRTVENLAGDYSSDPLDGDEVATDFVAGAAGGAFGHVVSGWITRAASAIHPPEPIGPNPMPGRNFRARLAARNQRIKAHETLALTGFAGGTAAGTGFGHWVNNALTVGLSNSFQWMTKPQPFDAVLPSWRSFVLFGCGCIPVVTSTLEPY